MSGRRRLPGASLAFLLVAGALQLSGCPEDDSSPARASQSGDPDSNAGSDGGGGDRLDGGDLEYDGGGGDNASAGDNAGGDGDAGSGDGGVQAPREIGEPCAADGECASGLCLTELANGYCSADCVCLDCAEKVACPDGSHPTRLYLGGYVCRCMELCVNASTCQPGYACSMRNGANVCLPPA